VLCVFSTCGNKTITCFKQKLGPINIIESCPGTTVEISSDQVFLRGHDAGNSFSNHIIIHVILRGFIHMHLLTFSAGLESVVLCRQKASVTGLRLLTTEIGKYILYSLN